ncbi:MAG: hypothetical protein LBL82_02590 [Oscillospiraceae bacterium]|jgi:hypothetical protein|nr:hypothetical protein [Oscillospiraceae bacterium]
MRDNNTNTSKIILSVIAAAAVILTVIFAIIAFGAAENADLPNDEGTTGFVDEGTAVVDDPLMSDSDI